MKLSPEKIRELAAQAGFDNIGSPDLDIAVAVCFAESGGQTEVRNTSNSNGSVDHGLWQINSVHKKLLSEHDWQDPAQNARMARRIFIEAGYRWAPWAAFNNRSYLKFMPKIGKTVTVTAGDTLSKIARAHGTTWQKIWSLPQNAVLVEVRKSPERLRVGDVIVLPKGV